MALVPNGIDVDRLRTTTLPGALRRELAIPPLSPVVLYVGRNARVKNIPRLLDVVRQLLQTTPEAYVVLAGDGLDRSVVDGSDLASASRLPCLGPRDDIPSLLRDATLLCSPRTAKACQTSCSRRSPPGSRSLLRRRGSRSDAAGRVRRARAL